MLYHHHQTLLSSSSSFFLSSPSKSLSFLHLPHSHSSQVGKERRLMEFSLSSSVSCVNGYDGENMSLVPEKNDVISIDEYLADEYFLEMETEDEENQTHQQQQEEEGEGTEKMGCGEEGENSSNSPSVFSFEAPPPLSELPLPAHDVAELEWVSIIMDESLSEIPKTYESHQIPPKIKVDDEAQNQDQPPPPLFVPIKAKRSKRARTLSGSWSSPSSSSSSTTTTTAAAATSSASSPSFSSPQLIVTYHPFDEIPHPASRLPPPPSKKRGRKPKVASSSQTESREAFSHRERRCSHCGVNKTPQWRTGPHGAKTLCNACGVRYKSGRLLPEYRPACSPTFISHVHSNSHRKVLEMRRKKEERDADKLLLVCSAPPVASF